MKGFDEQLKQVQEDNEADRGIEPRVAEELSYPKRETTVTKLLAKLDDLQATREELAQQYDE